MKRDLLNYLENWKSEIRRKPVLLRGARQVGKTYLAREFGQQFDNFIEINFELTPGLKTIFNKDLDPKRIVRELSVALGVNISPGNTLLFFDEIQECPNAITSLRYFYENMPEIHVMSAGSLIDFVLDEIGIPVGRVIPIYMYPLSFMEFLSATGNDRLRDEISNHSPSIEMPEPFHKDLLRLFGEYMAVGGMPESVKKWIDTGDLKSCFEIHRLLIDTIRLDFPKYVKRKNQKYVEMVFNSVPRLLGNKFVFVSVSPHSRSRELKPALDLLTKAGVVHIISHSSSNGIPLGSEINPSVCKVLSLDVAISQSILGLDYGQWILDPSQAVINLGSITESFVGQELLAYSLPTQPGGLYYWTSENKGGNAEVDYVAANNGNIIPIEVKPGVTGSLKSMNVFLERKKHSPYGIQFSQRNYYIDERRRIVQYPLYAISSAISRKFVKG